MGRPKKETKEMAVIEDTSDAVSLMSPKDLQAQISEETEKRKLITTFIKDHLKDGTDFGKIHINKTCPNKFNCSNKYHFSKDTLFKPGAEKFASLFKLRAESNKDEDTWEMLGRPSGTICYTTKLYTTKDVLVGEGKGAASVAEKGNPNTAIKIAKKRAFVDSVLSTGALSDFFTQDLEDIKDTEPEIEDTPVVPTVTYDEPGKPEISDRAKIAFLCKELNISLDGSVKERIKALTSLDMVEGNYKEIISRLEMITKERKNLTK